VEAASNAGSDILKVFLERHGSLAALRFDLTGELLPPDAATENVSSTVPSALYHHGDDPDRAGYNLGEVLHLSRRYCGDPYRPLFDQNGHYQTDWLRSCQFMMPCSAHAPQAAMSLRLLAGIIGRVRQFAYGPENSTALQLALSDVRCLRAHAVTINMRRHS